MSISSIIKSFEWVPELSPTISPMVVVIMPDVSPKLSPVFNECFISNCHVKDEV